MYASKFGPFMNCNSCAMTALCLTLASSLLAVHPAAAQFTMQARLTNADIANDDYAGISVAIDGDTAVFGAQGDNHPGFLDGGSATVFVRSGGVLTQQAKLTASDAADSDNFGNAIAISGDTVIVGAYVDDNAGGDNAGSAYVFVRSGSIWTEQAKLTALDGAASDFFGISVAIDGDTAVVGAYFDTHAGGTFAGAAYVFVRSGTVWTQQAKLIASDAAAEDLFGKSVAISGNTVIVGAYDDEFAGLTRPGSAYIFVRSGSVWTQQAKLIADDPADFDIFGDSVAIDGETAIVGAPYDDEPGMNEPGSVYVFVRSGTIWTQQARLVAAMPINEGYMGHSVAIDGNRVIAGAYNEDPGDVSDAGSAYVFVRSGTSWSQQARLNVNTPEEGDAFGFSVSVSGDTALVGAPAVSFIGTGKTGAAFMIALGDFDTCPADTTGDGLVGVPDLLKVINGWGVCP